MAPTADHPRVYLRCFGTPELHVGEQVIRSFRSGRVVALLAYLSTCADGRCSRDELAAALWSAKPPDAARQNLRQTLLYVRSLLEAQDVLHASRSEIRVDRALFSTDVADFRASLETGDASAAIRVYAGPFLAGFDDPWIEELRTRLSFQFMDALLEEGAKQLAEYPKEALELAERACKEDPYRDEAWTLKIRALKQLGRSAEARRQFTFFRDLMSRDLGMEPSSEVVHAIRGDESAEPVRSTPPPASLSPVMTLLEAGREEEAWNLAFALNPYWLEASMLSVGIEEWERVLAQASASVHPDQKRRAFMAQAELYIASGQFRQALNVLECAEGLQSVGQRIHWHHMVSRASLQVRASRAARTHALQSLRLSRAAGDLKSAFTSARLLLIVAITGGDVASGGRAATRAIELARQLKDRHAEAEVLVGRAHLSLIQNRRERATADLRRSQSLVERSSSARSWGLRVWAARLREHTGDHAFAERRYRDAVELYRSREEASMLAMTLTYLGDLLVSSGRGSEAIAFLEEARDLRRELGDPLGEATALRGLGAALADLADWPRARAVLRESVSLFRDQSSLVGAASSAVILALVEAELGNASLASRLAARSLEIYRAQPVGAELSHPVYSASFADRADRFLAGLRG